MMKMGRNDSCHCGSGEKYKKCCLLKDMATKKNDNKSVTPLSEFAGGMENEMLKIKKMLEGKNFSSAEGVNSFLANNLEEINNDTLKEEYIKDPLSRAQELIYTAWDYKYAKDRVACAVEALEISADCADAYCILAEDKAKKLTDKMAYYQKGIEAGMRALGSSFFRENKNHFWGLVESRPFMRAKLGFALKLWEFGDKKEAISHCWDLLELNENDNQGVRYLLINFLIETKNNKELEKLFDSAPNDGATMWLYPKALGIFQNEGNSKKAVKTLKVAFKRNEYVPEYLLGKKKLPLKQPDYYASGSAEEAALYIREGFNAWQLTDGALEWLKNNIAT
jgi:hypothetical protein